MFGLVNEITSYKTTPAGFFPPQVEAHLRRRRLSAGRAAPQASAAPRGGVGGEGGGCQVPLTHA